MYLLAGLINFKISIGNMLLHKEALFYKFKSFENFELNDLNTNVYDSDCPRFLQIRIFIISSTTFFKISFAYRGNTC